MARPVIGRATTVAVRRVPWRQAAPTGVVGCEDVIYRLLFTVVLRRLDAEAVHHATVRLLGLLGRVPGLLWLIGRVLRPRDPILRSRPAGIDMPSPLGLAAGFDKDAKVHRALTAFGFGFVEVGTVTGEAQPGNPRPRMFRLPRDHALINRMGFNNDGSAVARERLLAHPPTGVLGINIGKTKAVPAEEAADDYVASTERLAALADYLVVNVSSPNTPGLRDLQAVESLRPLLKSVQGAAPDGLPVMVKIAPDLADADIDAVADLAVELGLAGIIATNTTVSRDGLATRGSVAEEAGGLSGAPLRDRSMAVLRRLHRRVGDHLVIVSVGGVETAEDVWDRLAAGARLVQAYTGLVYGGPLWPSQVNRDLAGRLRAEGFASLDDLIGSAAS